MSDEQVQQLIADLAASDTVLRENARQQLIAMGAEAVAPLTRVILAGSGKQSWRAVKIISCIQDERVFEVLCQALGSEHPIVRETAASELGKLGDRRAVPLLINALNDDYANVQLWVIQALRDLGDSQVVPVLLQKLPHMESASLRYTTIEALGILGDSSVIPAIIPYQHDEDHHVRDRVEVAVKRLRQQA